MITAFLFIGLIFVLAVGVPLYISAWMIILGHTLWRAFSCR